MKKNKTGIFSTVFMLLEKFAPLYIGYLTHKHISEKILRTSIRPIRQLSILLIASITLATISWILTMGILFISLQSFRLTILQILSILLGINIILIGIVIARILQIKRKILG